MRALFKELLKGHGTPVLQTRDAEGETILSAANIWTSAHARRIELRESGLAPGNMLVSEPRSAFEAVIDLVACAIGGFVYLPAAAPAPASLRDRIAATPGALLALPGCDPAILTGKAIAEAITRLSRELGTPVGGTRLSCRASHCDKGLVIDLLLGLWNRQTIHLRAPDWLAHAEGIAEAVSLDVDDLVLAPADLDALGDLAPQARAGLSRMRLDTCGEPLSDGRRELAESLFAKVFVESYSTVTDLARLRGWSTSVPFTTATW
ncbi:MAG: hypothetical protein V2I39_11370 [Erythrobacter sp.]|jgi:hypothetical protein|nr:hypothetical protein [Erythrobacter sp.]